VDDWQRKVNGWPINEGLIDYIEINDAATSTDNPYLSANIIANRKLNLNGKTIDTSDISTELLLSLHGLDGVATNVTTGYHPIGFLLWGQYLNDINAGSGERPVSDFDTSDCTGGQCDRRIAYLQAATALLIEDLTWMTAQWQEHSGTARLALTAEGVEVGLGMMITGMGSLSYGEIVGVQDVYLGQYHQVDGTLLEGPSISDLVAREDAELDQKIKASLANTMSKLQALVDSAEAGIAYDQLIGKDNAEGNAKVQAVVDALKAQTLLLAEASQALGLDIGFEGSDALGVSNNQ
jgi:putative iron-regulated protein